MKSRQVRVSLFWYDMTQHEGGEKIKWQIASTREVDQTVLARSLTKQGWDIVASVKTLEDGTYSAFLGYKREWLGFFTNLDRAKREATNRYVEKFQRNQPLTIRMKKK